MQVQVPLVTKSVGRTPDSPRRGLSFLPLAALCLAAAAAVGQAQTASENYGNVDTWLGQGNASVTGPQALRDNACVPTASANGLSYVEAYQLFVSKPDPFTVSPNDYTAVNALITSMGTTTGGTTTSGQMNGLKSYLGAGGANPAPNIKLSGQVSPMEVAGVNGLTGFYGGGVNAGIAMRNENPTARFMAHALSQNSGLEMGIAWGSVSGGTFTAAGGHEVTVTSINMSGGSGTIGILDPWGTEVGGHAGSSATVELLSVTTVTITGRGSFLQVTYPDLYVGPDEPSTSFFAGGGKTGIIVDTAVQSVPDGGTTSVIFGSAAFGLMAWRRRLA